MGASKKLVVGAVTAVLLGVGAMTGSAAMADHVECPPAAEVTGPTVALQGGAGVGVHVRTTIQCVDPEGGVWRFRPEGGLELTVVPDDPEAFEQRVNDLLKELDVLGRGFFGTVIPGRVDVSGIVDFIDDGDELQRAVATAYLSSYLVALEQQGAAIRNG